jgi:penicillin-binding protein 1A
LANGSRRHSGEGFRARLRSVWEGTRDRISGEGRLLTVLALIAIGFLFMAAGVAMGAWTSACAGGCPTAEQAAVFAPQQASEIYDAQGERLGQFYRERRRLVSLSDLPDHVPLAFVAIEDRRFFDHEGVDVRRLFGALRDNLVGGFGGGSTITMQLARNLWPQQLPRGEKTMRRKLAEIRVAMDMERRLSKYELLELYLNHIYLGAGAYGIEAAARAYFGKPASELTPVEAATLAGLPQAPHAFNPRRNPTGAERRRNLALIAMGETRVIPREAADSLRQQPLALAPPIGALQAPYFVEHVRRELEDTFGELLYTGGLRIHTTLNAELQDAAETALEEHLAQIERGRYGRYTHPSYARFVEERREEEDPGPVVNTPYLQGIVTVIDPNSGAVLALVGGRNFWHSQFNRATQALRQPGSAFKPFIFAAAMEAGRSPNYMVSDQPLFIAQPDGSTWAPRNFGGEYVGLTSLREALRRSRNMVAIRLGREVGFGPVESVARRTGLSTPIPDYPSIYIGAADVIPIELVAAYGAFANGGMRVRPHFVSRIEDNEGNLLWQSPRSAEPAMDPAVAWLTTDMMREVVDRGTAYGVRNPAVGNLSYNVPAAGKTGTTNDATDVWFVGYTPDLVAGVWLGFDRPTRISGAATGGALAVPVWARVVRKFYDGRSAPPAWERPSGVVVRRISHWTGKAVTDDCPYAADSYTDYFFAGAAPAPGCEPPDEWRDPNPELLGEPAFPGGERGVPRQR